MLIGITIIKVRMVIVGWLGKYSLFWPPIQCQECRQFLHRQLEHCTNSDLAFTSVGPNSRLLDRCVLKKFSKSYHRPSLITPPRFALSVPSMPVKPWNFCKSKWIHYIALKNKFVKTLLLPDLFDLNAAYQDFCNIIKTAAKMIVVVIV